MSSNLTLFLKRSERLSWATSHKIDNFLGYKTSLFDLYEHMVQ
jgi:hypothetical protein